MLFSSSFWLVTVAISCFSLVGISYVYKRKKKKTLFDARPDKNLKLIWETSYCEFEYRSFQSEWIDFAKVMEAPPLKIDEGDTVNFLSDLSNSKELLIDEIERYLGDSFIQKNQLSVDHTFGQIVRFKLKETHL